MAKGGPTLKQAIIIPYAVVASRKTNLFAMALTIKLNLSTNNSPNFHSRFSALF